MKTPWTDKVDKELPLNEYPRPQLMRAEWLNLNGTWDYAITKQDGIPSTYDGQITVPFSPETELSGVMRTVRAGDRLWYHRIVTFPACYAGRRAILHFGAADQTASVYVNGQWAISHVGGYLPFECDVTDLIKDGTAEITVCVTDDTDGSYHARGKQSSKRGGIWYTPQSGLWQSVWMEAVPQSYIRSLKITPDFDAAQVCIEADVQGSEMACALFDGQRYVLPARIDVPGFTPWTPETPKLYDFTVECGEDRVNSYFAMRKFSVEADGQGIKRLFLNGRPYYHNGLLDQGYWPDGLYTAPTDEALIFDITTAKAMGFNMLRKHIKVEPLRWYYHCDRLGMLVWQDMPCGGGLYHPAVITTPVVTGISIRDSHYRLFARQDAAGRAEYTAELEEMIRHLYNCPCIAVWVPFNEGWGQFDAGKAVERILSLDTTRTVDHASGWHDQGLPDLYSRHVYFRKFRFKPDRHGRAAVLSEFGGYNHRIPGHAFNEKDFGYKALKGTEQYASGLARLFSEEIRPVVSRGLAASVYTQLTDVEDELNGLITYDRQVCKLPPERVKEIVTVEQEPC